MLEHPYLIEKLREYREAEISWRLLRRIQSCLWKVKRSNTTQKSAIHS
jgi:hypothetical protein